MSHFTVTVRLSKELLDRHEADVDAALEAIMAPFNEQPKKGSPYLKFVDETEEVEKKYAEGGTEKTFRDRYPSVEAFARDYYGYEVRQRGGKRRFGSWRNPNAKWDWYQIGGRWRGHFPLKPGKIPVIGRAGTFDNEPGEGGDVVRVGDVDFDRVAERTREAAGAFYREWAAYVDAVREGRAPTSDPFEGPRRRALRLGLCRVVQEGPVTLAPGEVADSWARHPNIDGKRRGWHDALRLPASEKAFREVFEPCFSPLLTYAVLDGVGWHAPGEMGWYGCSSDTPEDYTAFVRGFAERFVRSAGSEDVLVLVDCHI